MRFFQAVITLTLVIGLGCAREETVTTVGSTTATHVSVQTAEVERSRLHATLTFTGTLLPIRATTIVPDVEGIIESFPLTDRAVEYIEDGQTGYFDIWLTMSHRGKELGVLKMKNIIAKLPQELLSDIDLGYHHEASMTIPGDTPAATLADVAVTVGALRKRVMSPEQLAMASERMKQLRAAA